MHQHIVQATLDPSHADLVINIIRRTKDTTVIEKQHDRFQL